MLSYTPVTDLVRYTRSDPASAEFFRALRKGQRPRLPRQARGGIADASPIRDTTRSPRAPALILVNSRKSQCPANS
jgi:hypothetical protein